MRTCLDGLATFPSDRAIRLGSRHAWDDPPEEEPLPRSGRDADARLSTRAPSATAGA